MSYLQEQSESRKLRRWFVYGITTFIFIAGTIGLIYGLKPLMLPFIMGAFFAYLFKPLAKSFQTTHWTQYIRLGVLMGVTAFSLYGASVFISKSLPTEAEKVVLKVRLQFRLHERYQSWMGLDQNQKGNFLYENLGQDLEPLKSQISHYLDLNEKEQTLLLGHLKRLSTSESEKYLKYYNENSKNQNLELVKAAPSEVGVATNGAKKSSGFLAGILKSATSWIIFPLVFIFILLDNGQILQFFMRLVPNRYFELAYSVVGNVDEALGKYIRGTLIECALVGVSLVVGFYLCGFELQVSILIGIIGGLTNAIPFVGTAIACVLSAAYALIAENINPLIPFVNLNNLMLVAIGVVMVVHLLDNAIFQPLVVGKLVNLHPLVVVLGVFGGSMMFGFAGLILAIPTIVILLVVTKTFFTGLQRYKII